MNHKTETFDRYDSADYVNTFDDVALYLEALIDEGEDDPRMIAHALAWIHRLDKRCAVATLRNRWCAVERFGVVDVSRPGTGCVH